MLSNIKLQNQTEQLHMKERAMTYSGNLPLGAWYWDRLLLSGRLSIPSYFWQTLLQHTADPSIHLEKKQLIITVHVLIIAIVHATTNDRITYRK